MKIKRAELGQNSGCTATYRASLSAVANRYRYWVRSVFLVAQRRRWPLPRPIRRMVGAIIRRAAYQPAAGLSSGTDEWPDAAISSPGPEGRERISMPSAARCAAGTEPAPPPIGTAGEARAGGQPRLRCLVATRTLGLAGLEMVAALLARGLPSHDFDAEIAHTPVARSRDGQTSEGAGDPARLDGLPVVELSKSNIRPWLKTHRPDVISVHGPPDWLLAAAAEAHVPCIETLHSANDFEDRSKWRAEQLRSRRIADFVAVSERIRRQYLMANPRFPANRVTTIPNAVAPQNVVPRDRTKARAWLQMGNEFLFVSLARYAVQKNAYGLVAAFPDVARAYPGTHLLIAGSVNDRSYLDQVRLLRDTLPCAAQIHLCGPCPDVPTVLAAADGFVLDSFFEGGPLASMEALCTGLPVVLSEVGAAREQIGEDGRRGFVVPNPLGAPEIPDWETVRNARFAPQVNRPALVEAMSAVVAAREHWRLSRERLRAEALSEFSADLCLRRYAAVLRGAIARKAET